MGGGGGELASGVGRENLELTQQESFRGDTQSAPTGIVHTGARTHNAPTGIVHTGARDRGRAALCRRFHAWVYYY